MQEELNKARETVARLEAQAKREDEGMFKGDKFATDKEVIVKTEPKFELGSNAYGSGNTIHFIKSFKFDTMTGFEEEKKNYIKVQNFCTDMNKNPPPKE